MERLNASRCDTFLQWQWQSTLCALALTCPKVRQTPLCPFALALLANLSVELWWALARAFEDHHAGRCRCKGMRVDYRRLRFPFPKKLLHITRKISQSSLARKLARMHLAQNSKAYSVQNNFIFHLEDSSVRLCLFPHQPANIDKTE